MARADEVFALLKKKGQDGATATDIAKRFGFKVNGSACKLIIQLRSQGHNIQNLNGRYTLINDAEHKIETPTIEDAVEPDTTPSNKLSDIKPDQELNSVPVTTIPDSNPTFTSTRKYERVLETLIHYSETGATAAELAKYSGVEERNICYHIHTIRKNGNKIDLREGKYILKKLHGQTSVRNLPMTVTQAEFDPNAKLAAALNDNRLYKGIDKVSPEDKSTYMDLIKKVVYYRQCALNLLETAEMLNTKIMGAY